MLFLLTGDVQTGKTRWLSGLIDELEGAGVRCEGVLAPGVWRTRDGVCAQSPASERFEKLGIDNVLLPDRQRITFARRRDLAQQEGAFNPNSESAQARLLWEMPNEALATVNAHFARLKAQRADTQPSAQAPVLLVIDELGQLELRRGGGLTEALSLLEAGPRNEFDHALAIVRESLVDSAQERLSGSWKSIARIFPSEDARELVAATLSASQPNT